MIWIIAYLIVGLVVLILGIRADLKSGGHLYVRDIPVFIFIGLPFWLIVAVVVLCQRAYNNLTSTDFWNKRLL